MGEIGAFLKEIDIFNNFKQIEDIEKRVRIKHYSKNEIVYLEGDIVDRFMILKSGKIEVYRDDESGKKLTLWYIRPKEPFCLAAYVLGRAVSNIKSVDRSTVYYINRRDMESILKKYPELYPRILHHVSERLSAKANILHRVALGNAKKRIYEVLMDENYILSDKDGNIIPLTQNEIASLSGVCRETVCRVLSELRKNGILDIHQRQIVLKDLKKLEYYCDSN
ncbi:Crp/Fnr family transcriptional regulator [Hippea sp. KM1]|uniref:Crp/Fnr family transcriptional regulator n=1 Tax=Hippea sp. KM1 TaxID=944481 RepID=UPI00046D5722|nr:Crp/Fnr family transcriptional regulator [Hippea sp. KM1]